eukprot:PLAT9204.1.p1 GENE.PLAT9204.1~~PLAT9204.1.p1  ORF type:complete len:1219 (-),score=610.96 PLAT9204.1:76-3654(-)
MEGGKEAPPAVKRRSSSASAPSWEASLKKWRAELSERLDGYLDATEVKAALTRQLAALLKRELLPENPYVLLLMGMMEEQVRAHVSTVRMPPHVPAAVTSLEPGAAVTRMRRYDFWGYPAVLAHVDGEALTALVQQLRSNDHLLGGDSAEAESAGVRVLPALLQATVLRGSLSPYATRVFMAEEVVVPARSFTDATARFVKYFWSHLRHLERSGDGIVIRVSLQAPAGASGGRVAAAGGGGGGGGGGGSGGSGGGSGGATAELLSFAREKGVARGDGKLDAATLSDMIGNGGNAGAAAGNVGVGDGGDGSGGGAEETLPFTQWSMHDIVSRRREFLTAVKSAASESRSITYEAAYAVLEIDDGDDELDEVLYLLVHKSVSMHWQQAGGKHKSYARAPLAALATGVMLSERDATLYAALGDEVADEGKAVIWQQLSAATAAAISRGDALRMYERACQLALWSSRPQPALLPLHRQLHCSVAGWLDGLAVEVEAVAAVVRFCLRAGKKGPLVRRHALQAADHYDDLAVELAKVVSRGSTHHLLPLRGRLTRLLAATTDARSARLRLKADALAALGELAFLLHAAAAAAAYDIAALTQRQDGDGDGALRALLAAHVPTAVRAAALAAADPTTPPNELLPAARAPAVLAGQRIIDVSSEVSRSVRRKRFIPAAAREGVVMQYVADMRLDEALTDVLSLALARARSSARAGGTHGLPFPALLAALQAWAARASFWHRCDGEVRADLLPARVSRISAALASAQLPHVEGVAYGHPTLMRLTRPDQLAAAWMMLADLRNSLPPPLLPRGYVAHVSFAVEGDFALQPVLPLPLLPAVAVAETVTVSGAAARVAADVFARLTAAWLKAVATSTAHRIVAVAAGRTRFTPAQLDTDGDSLLAALRAAARQGQPVDIVGFLAGASYVPFHKAAALHFVGKRRLPSSAAAADAASTKALVDAAVDGSHLPAAAGAEGRPIRPRHAAAAHYSRVYLGAEEDAVVATMAWDSAAAAADGEAFVKSLRRRIAAAVASSSLCEAYFALLRLLALQPGRLEEGPLLVSIYRMSVSPAGTFHALQRSCMALRTVLLHAATARAPAAPPLDWAVITAMTDSLATALRYALHLPLHYSFYKASQMAALHCMQQMSLAVLEQRAADAADAVQCIARALRPVRMAAAAALHANCPSVAAEMSAIRDAVEAEGGL